MVVVAEAVHEVFDVLDDRRSHLSDPSDELHDDEDLRNMLGTIATLHYAQGDFMREVFTALVAEATIHEPLMKLLKQLVNGYIDTEELKAELRERLEPLFRGVMDGLSEESEKEAEEDGEDNEGDEEVGVDDDDGEHDGEEE